MTVSELQKILDKLDPQAEVNLYLNASMVDREPLKKDDGCEYRLDPIFKALWSTEQLAKGGKADILSIEVSV